MKRSKVNSLPLLSIFVLHGLRSTPQTERPDWPSHDPCQCRLKSGKVLKLKIDFQKIPFDGIRLAFKQQQNLFDLEALCETYYVAVRSHRRELANARRRWF